jgi:hypothetical protein
MAAIFGMGVIFHLLSIVSFSVSFRIVSERLIQRELIGSGGMISCMVDLSSLIVGGADPTAGGY